MLPFPSSFSRSNSADLIITESLIRLFGELSVLLVKVNTPVKVWFLDHCAGNSWDMFQQQVVLLKLSRNMKLHRNHRNDTGM